MNADDRVSYRQAVWSSFQHKAKSQREMSSAEFILTDRWLGFDAETQLYSKPAIPLPVVLRGIHDFEGIPRRLEACEQSVEKARDYWFKAMGGL